MTEHEWVMLGSRAVACKGWRWMPGMLTTYGYRATVTGDGWAAGVQDEYTHPKAWGLEPWSGIDPWTSEDMLPDFSDPATLGCLLALVREARPGCALWVARDCVVDPLDDTEYMLDEREGWTVCGGSGEDYLSPYGSGRTEAASLVAALEAADD